MATHIVLEGCRYLHQPGNKPSMNDQIVLVKRINSEQKVATVIGENNDVFPSPLTKLVPLQGREFGPILQKEG